MLSKRQEASGLASWPARRQINAFKWQVISHYHFWHSILQEDFLLKILCPLALTVRYSLFEVS